MFSAIWSMWVEISWKIDSADRRLSRTAKRQTFARPCVDTSAKKEDIYHDTGISSSQDPIDDQSNVPDVGKIVVVALLLQNTQRAVFDQLFRYRLVACACIGRGPSEAVETSDGTTVR